MTEIPANTAAPSSAAPDRMERALSAAAAALLAVVLAALWRGRAEWTSVPPFIWLHIATVGTAVALTPVMLLRRRGDRLHRRLGWLWVSAMFLTAAFSFGVRTTGKLSLIHILSAYTLATVPFIVWTARTHQVARHRSLVRGMILGALILAGAFTLLRERLLGHWLFG